MRSLTFVRRFSALVACLCGLSCGSGGPVPGADARGDVAADGSNNTLHCALVIVPDAGGQPRHLVDGDAVELLKGYQGYLLVQVRAHLWGAVPRDVQLKVSGAKNGGPTLTTVLTARTLAAADDAHQDADAIEIWLTPPDPAAFVDRPGWLSLTAVGRGRTCVARVDVQFVDRTLCVHQDSGQVICP